jgi:hypothetical protein
MSDHISMPQMENFYARALAVPELTGVAEHMAGCAACRQLFRDVFRRRRGYAPVSFNLSPEAWLKNEHLEYEQVVSYVESKADETERELIDLHLKGCARCREGLRNFVDYRQEIEPEMAVRYYPEARRARPEKFARLRAWPRVRWVPAYAAIFLAIAGAVFLSTMFLSRSRPAAEHAQPGQPARTVESSPAPPAVAQGTQPPGAGPDGETSRGAVGNSSNTSAANLDSAGPTTPRPASPSSATSRPTPAVARTVSLNDGGGRVALDGSGNLTGLGDVSPQTQESIRQMLLAQAVERPDALTDVLGEGGTLRGADRQEQFKLTAPGGAVLVEDRPTFKWEPIEGAASYQVHVADPANREAAKSPELPATTTQWTPPAPLRRGVVYTWVVTATVDGRQITAPAPSAPEMRFKVLEAEKLGELDRLRKSTRSHLALGAFYARAGMVKQAEREFQVLAHDNPHSPVARKLLRSVRSWR